jgi:hypothetical protein
MLRHEAQAIDGIVAETRTQTFDERRRLAGETATVFTGPPERRGTRDHRPQASGAQFEADHRRGQDGARKMLGEQRSERGGTMLGGRQPQVQLGVQRDRGATLLGVSCPVREPQHQQVDPALSGAQEVFELDEQGLGLAQHGRCGIGFEGGIAACAEALARHLGTAHSELRVTVADAQAVVPLLPAMYDEPFGDSSQIPTHLICVAARRAVAQPGRSWRGTSTSCPR